MVGCPSRHATTDGGSTRPGHNLFLHTDPDNDHTLSLSLSVSYRWSFYLFGQTILCLIKVMKIVKKIYGIEQIFNDESNITCSGVSK
jgi:hypothetical protein